MDNKDMTKKMTLSFEAFAMTSDISAIAASSEFNGLFEVDLETGQCTFLCMFPGEKVTARRLYTKAIYVENKVYFVPAMANSIAIYDVLEKRMEMIPLDNIGTNRKKANFNGAVFNKGYIYMTPCTYPGILRIDIVTNEVKCFSDWIPEERFLFRKEPFVRKNKIFIPNTLNNMILEFDMDSCEGKLHNIGAKNNGSWCICGEEDALWIIPQNPGAVIYWEPENDIVKEFDSYPVSFEGKNFLFTKGIVREDGVYLLPAYANMMIQIDKITGVMSEYAGEIFANNVVTKYLFDTGTDVYLECTIENETRYIRWSYENKLFSSYSFLFCEGRDLLEKLFFMECSDEIKETKYTDINGLIRFISSKTYDSKNDLISENVGQKIIGELL